MVRFNCGCIGFPVNAEQYICISPCEEPDSPPYLTLRQISSGQQTSEPLSDAELKFWVAHVNETVRDGERYKMLQRVVKDFLA